MGKKAQVEFIAILGLVVIAIVVILLSYQHIAPVVSPVPSGIAQEWNIVKDAVESFVKIGADETIKTMETQGGYVDLAGVPSTKFLGGDVPYYCQCDFYTAPTKEDLAQNLASSVEEHIREGIDDVLETFPNVSVDLSGLDVDVNILSNKVDITVNIPTVIKGHPVYEPYTVLIPTMLGRIHDFATDFCKESTKDPHQGGRFFETFTIASIIHSNYLPVYGVSTECGDMIMLSSQDISGRLAQVVDYVLTHFLFWRSMGELGEAQGRVYALETVNGNKYEDLPMRLWLSDDFSVISSYFIFWMNMDFILQVWFAIIPYCVNGYYFDGYDVDYSVIVRVEDRLTGNAFHFADMVYVEDMDYGECGGEFEVQPPSPPCSELECTARLNIMSGEGNPVEGARVFFGNCEIGQSSPDGVVEGPIACGTHELVIWREGYSEYIGEVSSDDINDVYVLYRIPKIKINFNQLVGCGAEPVDHEVVYLTLESDRQSYTVSNLNFTKMLECKADVDPDFCEDNPLNCTASIAECQKEAILDSIEVDYIMSGDYKLTTMVTNPWWIEEYAETTENERVISSLHLETPEQLKKTFHIPESDHTLNVQVPESDTVYSRAMSIYWSAYHDAYGTQGCYSSCAQGHAMDAAIGYLTEEEYGGDYCTLYCYRPDFLTTMSECGRGVLEVA